MRFVGRLRSLSVWVALLVATSPLAACGSAGSGHAGGGDEGGGGAGGHAEGGAGGQGPTVECEAPPSPEVFEIGTGEACFSRLEAGAVIDQMNGPQGGYHVWLALGCTDCPPSLALEYAMLDPVTGEPLPGTFPGSQTFAELVAIGDGFAEAAGIQLGMPGLSWDPENEPPLPEGTKLVLDVRATNQAGELLHEDAIELELGPIVPWDPCDLHPEGDCCSDECI